MTVSFDQTDFDATPKPPRIERQDSRAGTRLRDRPEYAAKPKPLTGPATMCVADAVAAMSELNYGCVAVVDAEDRVVGIVTERDIMNRLVGRVLDPRTTTLAEIMTRNPRLAHEDDDMLMWLRSMSQNRFRRLPVVDDEGRIKAVFTQGDFVSYTWPDLIAQARSMSRAWALRNLHFVLIGGGIVFYGMAMSVLVQALA